MHGDLSVEDFVYLIACITFSVSKQDVAKAKTRLSQEDPPIVNCQTLMVMLQTNSDLKAIGLFAF